MSFLPGAKLLRQTALVIALTLTAATAANAQAPKAPVILGTGSQSCTQWTADRAANNINAQVRDVWVAGFLTGFNHTGLDSSKDVTSGQPATLVTSMIDQICAANPNMMIDEAMWRSLLVLLQNKGYDPSTLGQVPPLPPRSR